MQILSAQSLRALIAGQALRDPAFLAAVHESPASTVAVRFGAQPYAIRVVVEEPDELALLLPFRTGQLAADAHRTSGPRDRPPATKGELEALLAGRAWADPAFLAHLREDPRGAVNALLEEHGIDVRVPAGKTVRLYEERQGECVVVIPHAARPQAARSAVPPQREEEGAPATVVAPFRSLTTPSVLTGKKEK